MECRTLTTALTVFIAVCGGCDAESGTVPFTPTEVESLTLPTRCWTSLPARALFPLEGARFAANFRPTLDVSMANLTVFSDDGRSFERPVADMERPRGELRRAPLAASSGVFPLGGGDFLSLDGLVGVSRLPGSGDTFSTLDWLVLGVGGEVRDVFATSGSFTVGGVEKVGRTWELGGVRVGEEGVWLHASKDGGATYEVVGWRAFGVEPYPGLSRTTTLAADRTRAILEEPTSRRWYLVRPGDTPRDLFVNNAAGGGDKASAIGLWGERLVYVREYRTATGAPIDAQKPELVVASLDGTDKTTLPWPTRASRAVHYATSDDGALWILPSRQQEGNDTLVVLRVEPDAGSVKQVPLDLGPAPMAGVMAALPRAGGKLLMSVETYPERDRRGGDTFGSAMFCEVGPGVAAGFEGIGVAPLDALMAAPEAIVRVARVGDGTTVGDRFLRTASGRVVATQGRDVRIAGPDTPPLYHPGDFESSGLPASGELPATTGYEPGAPLSASETHIELTLRLRSQLTDPPRTQRVVWDRATLAVTERAALPFGNDQVLDAQRCFGTAVLTTEEGAFLREDLFASAPDERVELLPGVIVGEGFGAVLDDGYTPAAGIRGTPNPVWLARFDPAMGRVPAVFDCQLAETPPDFCIAIDDSDIVAARFDTRGDLYLLDFRHGRVLRLAAGGTVAEKVAEGFASPSDLRVTSTPDGETAVLVYDGDVFAFRPRPGQVARLARGGEADAGKGSAGRRDPGGCLADGPCVDLAALGGAAGGAEVCLQGVRFGTGGRARVTRQVEPELTVSRWSETEVCVQAGTLSTSALITLERADGRTSQAIPWVAPVSVGAWELPPVVRPTSEVVVRGRGFGDGLGLAVTGAWLASATDTELRLRVPKTALVVVQQGEEVVAQRLVEVSPDIVRPCRSSRVEGCEVVALGLGDVRGEVTIGGRAAAIARWRPPFVEVSWPEGLAPGTHELRVSNTEGAAATATAVLEAGEEVTLIGDASLDRVLDYMHGRPVDTPLGVLMGANSYAQFSPASELVGVSATGPVRGSVPEVPGLNALHLAVVDGVTLVLGNSVGGVAVLRVEPGGPLGTFGGLAMTLVGKASGVGFLSAVAPMDGGVLVVGQDLVRGMTGVFELRFDPEQRGGSIEVSALGETPGTFGFDATQTDRRRSAGAWLADGGVFVGECRNPTRGAELYFAPLLELEGGERRLGGREVLVQDPDARILTCAVAGDTVLWVERKGDVETVQRWSASTLGPRQMVASLPTTLPGVGQINGNQLAGVVDVMMHGEDLLVLLADRETEAHGMRVARWDAAGGTWSLGEAFGTRTRAEPGELCVGPMPTCPDEARGAMGCAPLACPVRPAGRVDRPATHPQDGYLAADNGNIRVFYEVTNTQRTPGFVLGGTELQTRVVPVP